MLILVIDDNEDDFTAAARFLKKLGHQSVHAKSFDESHDRIDSVDGVLCDVKLRGREDHSPTISTWYAETCKKPVLLWSGVDWGRSDIVIKSNFEKRLQEWINEIGKA